MEISFRGFMGYPWSYQRAFSYCAAYKFYTVFDICICIFDVLFNCSLLIRLNKYDDDVDHVTNETMPINFR